MGAVTLIRTFPYSYGDFAALEKLRHLVDEQVKEDGYNSGHCYSGTWSSLNPGLDIRTEKIFESVEAARNWMVENLEKFEPLVAVLARQIKSSLIEGDSKLTELTMQLKAVVSQRETEPYRIVKEAKSAALFKTCKSCGSRLRLQHVCTVDCPLCRQNLLVTRRDRLIEERLVKQEKKLQAQIQKRREALLKRSKKEGIPDEELVWVVGGVCPS